MEKNSSPYLENFNIGNDNKSQINFYLFDNNSIYIIILNILVILIKSYIIKKQEKKTSNIFPQWESINESLNKIAVFRKRKNDINYKNQKINNYMSIILIKLLLLIIFCRIKSNNKFFNSFNHASSNITLKIKGKGYTTILGGHVKYNFTSFNLVREVKINGIKIDLNINNKYNFNEDENYVEITLDDNITNCDHMFYGCNKITEINFNNFDTSKVTSMSAMFCGCQSLTSLDLYSFDTSQVTNMLWMFYNCLSLTSLDLSNFNTSKLNLIQNMFLNCSNLEYINLKNFDESNLSNKIAEYQNMFLNIPSNAVICINENLTKNKIFPQIEKDINCYVLDCTENWKSKQKKIYIENNECIESFDNSPIHKYEYKNNEKCYSNCLNKIVYDKNYNTLNICLCQLDKCMFYPNNTLTKGLCTLCNTHYYPKENDTLNFDEFIKCYKEPEGYYLDNNLYKPCYYTCKTCEIPGNNIYHNCLECNANNHFEIKFNNYSNCYDNCSYYYYFDKENNKYYCTLNSSCPNEYPKLNKDKFECVKYNIENILDDLIIKEKNETEKMSKEEEIEYYDNLLDILEEGFTDSFDTSNIDEGQDEVIKTEKVTVTFTTVENQKNDINQNVTTIDLGDCENKLRNYYNLSSNETIYMKKIDVIQEGFNIPKVEYDVYSKLYGDGLIKLNLSVCENSKIIISIPINLIENIDIFNSSSGYYNDICYIATSEDGTDITLNDRKSNYINKNMSICQDGCEFSLYVKKKQKAGCTCNVKESSSTIADMKINKDKLIKNFKDIKNIINLNILVCYKNLLKKEGIINNIGCYILLSIIIFHIISIFVFYLSEFDLIKNKLKKIIFVMNGKQILDKKDEKIKEKKSLYNSNDISIYKKKKKKKTNKKNVIKRKILRL